MKTALLLLSTVAAVSLARAETGPKTPLDAFRRIVGVDAGGRLAQGGAGLLRVMGFGPAPMTVRYIEDPQPQWLRQPNLVDLVLGTRAHHCQRLVTTTGPGVMLPGVAQPPATCHPLGNQIGAYLKRLFHAW